MVERTLVIIKPDAVAMGNENRIKSRYLTKDFNIVRERRTTLTAEVAMEFYEEHEGKFFFMGTILAMTSGPCVILVLEGENAIETVRALNGATDPLKAALGTIRCDFRSAGGPFNTVHASDSEESFEREMQLLFSDA
ncbi:nucleoside-diphosphate kinase [Candidatus Parcubacteria bacterium]|nr:nucleoside-diphosphate kinase [Candidatus Parcubacteria bacterium]